NQQDGYREQIKILRDYGLQTWAAFTLGHDFDTKDSIKRTLEFALRNKFAFAAYNILMPYPGTPLYEKLKHENRLLYDGKWWLHHEYRFNHAAFIPARMTPDELTLACFEARKEFNSVGSIVSRAFDPKTNMRSWFRLLVYMMYNPLFRKEVFKKQDMRFGLS
ncbi:MAG: methylase, partial [Clostridiaceae bacterium]|nr:methylase [Clostridiaceae bacterium]